MYKMNRILIIGCGGAGKSTFSKKLNKYFKYELIHLDKLFWKPNWEKTSKYEWDKVVEEIIKKDKWIMDGNYNSTLEIRINRADTVIYFDFPRIVCIWNVILRTIKGRLFRLKRDDIANDCKEKFDLAFFQWIWSYNKNNKQRYLKLLNSLKKEKEIVIFNKYSDSNKFLKKLNYENQ